MEHRVTRASRETPEPRVHQDLREELDPLELMEDLDLKEIW